jgi:hypothetical protein
MFDRTAYWARGSAAAGGGGDGQEVRFTVNLSVILRDEWIRQIAAKPHLGQRPTPTNHYGSWADQARIGSLTPDRADKWWRVVRGASSDDVRDDTLHDLLTYAVPWLRERVA